MHISDNVFMKIHISIMPKLVLVLQCNLSAAIAAWSFDVKTCYIIEEVEEKLLFPFFFLFHIALDLPPKKNQILMSKDLNLYLCFPLFFIYLFAFYIQ